MKRQRSDMQWYPAPEISHKLTGLVKHLGLTHIDTTRIICYRSHGSVARARARIWSLPKVWQMALKVPAHYVIEVLSEKFDGLSDDDQTRVLIHELMHIPRNFSGALVPHRGRFHAINHKTVEQLFRKYMSELP